MRFLLGLLCCLVACGRDRVTAPDTPPPPIAPVDMDGVWNGTAGALPVAVALSWGGEGGGVSRDVYVAGGYGTIGGDSVHVTGTLHGDTLHVRTSTVYGPNQPNVDVLGLVAPDTITGQWTDSRGTTALRLHRLYKGPPH